jgi:2-hydroxychromene-2-carboxylate isomerase
MEGIMNEWMCECGAKRQVGQDYCEACLKALREKEDRLTPDERAERVLRSIGLDRDYWRPS